MTQLTVRLGAGGRIVLPGPIREAMGIGLGDELVVIPERGGARLLTRAEAVRRAQDLVAMYVDPCRSLTDELLAERRAESADE